MFQLSLEVSLYKCPAVIHKLHVLLRDVEHTAMSHTTHGYNDSWLYEVDLPDYLIPAVVYFFVCGFSLRWRAHYAT
jgi:hypothetical protein